MRVYVEGEDYLRWVEDFENNEMGLGLTERENGERCLGLFITYGGIEVSSFLPRDSRRETTSLGL